MPYEFQVGVDCADPNALADWWAQTLGWEVDEPDESFIRKMIAEGYAKAEDTVTRNGRLTWRDGAAIRHPDGPESGPGGRIYFQLVPEPKTVKNRWHVDVQVGPDNVESERAKLIARGATFLHTGQQGPHGWVTLADPEGNEFCIS